MSKTALGFVLEIGSETTGPIPHDDRNPGLCTCRDHPNRLKAIDPDGVHAMAMLLLDALEARDAE